MQTYQAQTVKMAGFPTRSCMVALNHRECLTIPNFRDRLCVWLYKHNVISHKYLGWFSFKLNPHLFTSDALLYVFKYWYQNWYLFLFQNTARIMFPAIATWVRYGSTSKLWLSQYIDANSQKNPWSCTIISCTEILSSSNEYGS